MKIDRDEEGIEYIIDDLGGLHQEGIGWNPHGIWCGKCSNTSCEECEFNDITGDELFFIDDDYNE